MNWKRVGPRKRFRCTEIRREATPVAACFFGQLKKTPAMPNATRAWEFNCPGPCPKKAGSQAGVIAP